MAELSVNLSVEELRKLYDDSASSKFLRAIIFGDIGSGKTTCLKTAPRPIFIDSFDPGGTKSIRDAVAEGYVIVDSRYEHEDPRNPSAIELWDKVYHERKKSGFFERIGTYSSDSLTMLSAAAMNLILKKRNRKDWIPQAGKGQDNDYVAMQAIMEPILRDILNLPCHVILTAHPDLSTDDATERKFIGPKVSGQLQQKLMLMTDEIYCAQATLSPKGITRTFLTQPDGLYRCRSRLASNGKILVHEEQNIRAILAKAGLSTEDKKPL